MARPDIENGYIRIANELWDEIIRRDFSKRQRAIIDFIWRLSYGTRKQYAVIPQLKYFEIAGIGKTHIKKELKHLEACRVLKWDTGLHRFEINDDHEKWQLTPNSGWDQEAFSDLIHLNIREATSYQNSNPVTKTVTELPKQEPTKDLDGYQNSNSPVTKTVTDGGDEPNSPNGFETPKDSIKDSDYKKEDDDKGAGASRLELDRKKIQTITALLYQNGFGLPGSIVNEDLNYWIEQGPFKDPHEVIVEAIKEAARSGANRWKFVDTVLRDWAKKNITTAAEALAYIEKRQHDQQQQREQREQQNSRSNRTGYTRKPIRTEKLPEWYQEPGNENAATEGGGNQTEKQDEDICLEVLEAYGQHKKDPIDLSETFNKQYPNKAITPLEAEKLINKEVTAAELLGA